MGLKGPLRVRLPPPVSLAREWRKRQTHRPQKAAHVSSSLTSRTNFSYARVAQTGRGGSLKKSPCAGSTPAARIPLARVAQSGRGSGLKHRRLRVRISPRAFDVHAGVYANGQRGLIFNQAPEAALRVRVPPPLPAIFTLVVAQTRQSAALCTRTLRVRVPSTDLYQHGALAKPGKARGSLPRKRGFKSRTPCQTQQQWRRTDDYDKYCERKIKRETGVYFRCPRQLRKVR